MDRFRAMKAFIAIADAGSLSAAARRLNMPLANISRLLSQLEGTSSTASSSKRTTRRMALTTAGRDYLDACRNRHRNARGIGEPHCGPVRGTDRRHRDHRPRYVRPPADPPSRHRISRHPSAHRRAPAADRSQHRSGRGRHRRRGAHRRVAGFGAACDARRVVASRDLRVTPIPQGPGCALGAE